MGKDALRGWVAIMRSQLTDVTPIFGMQSNGTLIDEEWIDLLYQLEIGMGISIDGPKVFHDRYRVDHKGKGSFEDVVDAIRLIQAHPKGKNVFSNVMAVVNTDIPPEDLFDLWKYLDVRGFDLSLPHANHSFPPSTGKMGYGDWMIRFFDLWFDQGKKDWNVRFFKNIMRMLFNYPVSTDNIGGRPVDVVVVETNGGIEPTDAFKCCEEGITKLKLNILKNDFDDLYGIPMVETLQQGATKLCKTCQSCALKSICGGGYMPHRFYKENGFNNPSVYCTDLTKLILHIRERVLQSMPEKFLVQLKANKEGVGQSLLFNTLRSLEASYSINLKKAAMSVLICQVEAVVRHFIEKRLKFDQVEDIRIGTSLLNSVLFLKQLSPERQERIIFHPSFNYYLKAMRRHSQEELSESQKEFSKRIIDFLWVEKLNQGTLIEEIVLTTDDRGGLRLPTIGKYLEFGEERKEQQVQVSQTRDTLIFQFEERVKIEVPKYNFQVFDSVAKFNPSEEMFNIRSPLSLFDGKVEFWSRDPWLRVRFTGTNQRNNGSYYTGRLGI